MLDKATVLTTIFTRVDDTMKGSAVIQHALKRPGPAPRLSDSEVVTIALYQELIGEPREDHFFRLHQAGLRTFFPGLNERSRSNRRKRDLWSVILAVRVSLQLVLEALQLQETAAIDSAPVPCVGYKRAKAASDFVGTADYGVCSSKAMKYFGCKFHSVVSLSGIILGFLLTPANRYDNQPVVELCAMSRIRVSLVQPGGTGRTVPGSSTLPGSESSRGKQHSGKAIIIRQMIGKRDGKTRAIGVKLDCLKFPNHQRLKTGLTGKHLKPVPISARVINPDRGNLPRCGR